MTNPNVRTYSNPDGDGVDLKAQAILSKRRAFKETAYPIDSIVDDDWIKQSFLTDPNIEIDDLNKELRIYTSAEFKFEDSSLGGNHEINPRPQFTRYADARVKGRLFHREDTKITNIGGRHGMGHYYSEAIDDTSQVIHMRFGVPQFTSLTTFFTGFFDYRAAKIARTGRGEAGFFQSAGQAVGLVSLFIAWPVLAISAIATAISFLMNRQTTRFYSLKPSMPIYWYAVNTMVNQIGVNRGLYPTSLDEASYGKPGEYYGIDKGSMKILSELMPDVFSENGGIDVYAVANRAKRVKNALDKALADTLNSDSGETYKGYVEKFLSAAGGEPNDKYSGQKKSSIADALNSWFNSSYGKLSEKNKVENTTAEESVIKFDKETGQFAGDSIDDMKQHINAEFDDGSQFASFRVDATGPIQDSFSNSFAENDLASKFNNISSAGKAAYFSFAGYNVADALAPVIGAMKDFTGGVLDTVGFSGLLALGGSAFVDIPKNWENSTANLPKSNYTMTLISPYGNTISQMTNIYIPLCMLLAGALPLQTGKHSYTSPFLCEIYDRGRQQTRLGMIDSLSIQRGTSNLSFNKEGNPMAVEVTFSVADLSSVMSMPIVQRSIVDDINPLTAMFDDVNTFTDYMNTLSSLTLTQQVYKFSVLQLRAAQKARRLERFTSKARLAGVLHGFPPLGVFDFIFHGTDKI